LRERIGDQRGEAISRVKLASFYTREGEPYRAAPCFEAALSLARKIEDRSVQADALLGLGRLSFSQGDLAGALQHLQQALELAEALGLKRQLSEVHLAVAETCEAREDTRGALRHFKAYHGLMRQLTDEGIAKHVKRLTLQLELERARKDAEIERLRSVELQQANAQLEARDRENARLLEELRRQANEDALTGLPNRRSFSVALEKAHAHATRYARPLAVALADIDNFKRINDRYSHTVGDAVLKTLAGILAGAIREGDVVARIGGEEFAFVFPETARGEGLAVCERVRRGVAEYDWPSLHPDLQVTLSIGLAWDASVANAEKMLALADARLYHAKRSGKNRIG
jgi:diguanylate cyclase (GGDEF)-like protein